MNKAVPIIGITASSANSSVLKTFVERLSWLARSDGLQLCPVRTWGTWMAVEVDPATIALLSGQPEAEEDMLSVVSRVWGRIKRDVEARLFRLDLDPSSIEDDVNLLVYLDGLQAVARPGHAPAEVVQSAYEMLRASLSSPQLHAIVGARLADWVPAALGVIRRACRGQSGVTVAGELGQWLAKQRLEPVEVDIGSDDTAHALTVNWYYYDDGLAQAEALDSTAVRVVTPTGHASFSARAGTPQGTWWLVGQDQSFGPYGRWLSATLAE